MSFSLMSFDLGAGARAGAGPGSARGLRPGGGALTEEQRLLEEQRRARNRYRPTDRERELVDVVTRRYEQARLAKEPYYRTWALALAFYQGRQYERWEPVTRELIGLTDDDVPPWRELVTDNQITSMVLTAAAKWNRARHITMALPNNPQDPEDVKAAGLGTKALRHLDRITDRGRKQRNVELLRAIYGTAFLAPYWDGRRRSTVALVDPSTGAVRGAEAWVGEQDFEVLSVWEVFPQPVQWWHDVQWCVKCKVRPVEWVRDTFGERGLLVDEEALETDPGSLADAHRDPAGAGECGREPSVRVLEYYERPGRHYPDGRWLVVANDVLLYQEDRLPHPKHRFPIIPQFGIFVPESLWGMGVVEHLIGQQELLNKTESKIQENFNLTAQPKGIVAREADLDEDAFTSDPGEILEYTSHPGVPPPQWLNPPSMPAYAAEQPERIIDRMGRIAGINEVSRGEAPFPGSPGVVIQLLQDMDDTRFSLASEDAGDAWRELDQQMLESLQARYTVPRMLRVFGKDQAEEALAFLGTDLRGNTEVALNSTEGVSDSVATKRQRILDYFTAGMIPVDDPELLAELYREMGEQGLAEIMTRRAQRLAAAALTPGGMAADGESLAADERG